MNLGRTGLLRLTLTLLGLGLVLLLGNLYHSQYENDSPPLIFFERVPSPSQDSGQPPSGLTRLPRRYTEVECHQQGSFCHYTNLCYDGEALVMLADDSTTAESGPRTAALATPPVYMSEGSSLDIEVVTHENPAALLPKNQRWQARTMPASMIFGGRAVKLPLFVPNGTAITPSPELEVIWLDGPFYVQSSDARGYECSNVWHWSRGTLPLWTDQHINHTLELVNRHFLRYDYKGELVQKSDRSFEANELLSPPMQYVLSLCGKNVGSWHEGLLRALLPSHSQILYLDNLAHRNPELDQVWPGNRNYEGLVPVINRTGNLGLAPNQRLLCSKQAVVHTNSYTMFNSISEWRRFRKKVLESLSLPALANMLYAPAKVVFKATGRPVTNIQELLGVCRKYTTCEMTSEWTNRSDFKPQVEDVASAGIFVGSHGAGMTNLMFLPPYGAVIELFPYKWWPDMYRRMANEMGVPYFMVASFNRPNTIPDGDECIDVTAFAYGSSHCTHKVKNEPFDIPVDQFEATLITALQQIGVNALRHP